MKKTISLLLALVLSLSALPLAAAAQALVELKATHVTLDETSFVYTGQEIKPNVTVRADDQLLTLDTHYHLSFENNVQVGTAQAVVTGIGTNGYTGTVKIPFEIKQPLPLPITEEHVVLEKTEYEYTGQPITPQVQVTVEQVTLEQDRDYTLEYINNQLPGTATVIIRGIVTAQPQGYEGEVRKDFTIQSPATQPSDPTQPSEKPSEPTQPSETPTEPTEKPTEPTQPEKPKHSYQITKGNNAAWFQNSSAALSFTVDGPYSELTNVEVDGKPLVKADYTAKDGTVVLLKNSFLKGLKTGSHKITISFQEGKAEGTFRVSAADENPKTGDTLGFWLLSMAVTGLAIVGLWKKAGGKAAR